MLCCFGIVCVVVHVQCMRGYVIVRMMVCVCCVWRAVCLCYDVRDMIYMQCVVCGMLVRVRVAVLCRGCDVVCVTRYADVYCGMCDVLLYALCV